jgi:undecaprenyl diphosphate synthase
MMQSTWQTPDPYSLHIAIIMDGSGRWARQRGLAREAGHFAGRWAVERAVEAARRLGIGTLTLFAFSGDNWQRPANEVRNLMQVFEDYFRAITSCYTTWGIRVSVVGRRDRLGPSLLQAAEEAEAITAGGRTLHLRIALDYSGRDAILHAAHRLRNGHPPSDEEFARALAEVTHAEEPVPDIDLLIRSGGERRLSDFMLWESAYAELIFTDRLWPDFDAADLEAALEEFRRRDRRFGRIAEVAAG